MSSPAESAPAIHAGAERLWLLPLAGFVLAAAASTLCLHAAGPAHGVLFGACAAIVLLAPTLAAGAPRSSWAPLASVAAIATGALTGPVQAFAAGELNSRTFLPACEVFPAVAIAGAGLTLLLTSARLDSAAAAWLVTLLLLAWLSWPIWLSPWLAGREWLVDALSPGHPLLALDAALTREQAGPWIQRPLMYSRLTVLGQHVFPRPPEHVGWTVLLHVGVGAPGLFLAAIRSRRRLSEAASGSSLPSAAPGPGR